MPDYPSLRDFQALEKRVNTLERWKDTMESSINRTFKDAKGCDDAMEKRLDKLERHLVTTEKSTTAVDQTVKSVFADAAIAIKGLENWKDKFIDGTNKALQHAKAFDDQLDSKITDLRKKVDNLSSAVAKQA